MAKKLFSGNIDGFMIKHYMIYTLIYSKSEIKKTFWYVRQLRKVYQLLSVDGWWMSWALIGNKTVLI